MRIALLDAFFLPDQGYQAGPLFRHLIKLGHDVRMFSTCYSPLSFRQIYPTPLPEGVTELAGGVVHRLPATLLPRNLVLCRAVPTAVRDFEPDMTYVIYASTFFGAALFSHRSTLPGALFSSFGEHAIQRHSVWPWPLPLLKNTLLDTAFYLMKRRFVRQCLQVSDAALCVTPDTFDYILSRAGSPATRGRLARRCALYPLGFDPDVFYADQTAREAERKRLGLSKDDIVVLHAGKITPIKQFDIWVGAVSAAMREVPKLLAIVAGFSEGSPESDRIRSLIERSDLRDRFICSPFLPRKQLAALYNAADLGAWFWAASVSIQEAMGTGIYMLLNNSPTTCHLLLDPQTGRYFPEYQYDQLTRLIVETARSLQQNNDIGDFDSRVRRADCNRRRFGYDVLAQRLIAAAVDPAHAVNHVEGELVWNSKAI